MGAHSLSRHRALQFPGVSWRVAVVPPAAVAEAEAMGNASRAAAHLARNTRQAVLRVSGSSRWRDGLRAAACYAPHLVCHFLFSDSVLSCLPTVGCGSAPCASAPA